MIEFNDRVILVTGGSSGIGNATAQLFRTLGARVHVTGTRDSKQDYADKPGSDLDGLIYHRLDASDPAAVSDFGPGLDQLDVLVNCHGLVVYGRKEFEMETFNRVVQTNLSAVMDLCVTLKPLLVASKGNIVNVGSVASFRPAKANPAYSASKGGLLTLTRSLAAAWAGEGIRVNLLAPGFVITTMTEVTHSHATRFEATRAAIPLGRWGEPRDIANGIAFLASPIAAYITGEMLVIDGGVSN